MRAVFIALGLVAAALSAPLADMQESESLASKYPVNMQQYVRDLPMFTAEAQGTDRVYRQVFVVYSP